MTCTRCDATTADGIHLCHDCATTLEATLDQIPDTLDDAADTIARLDATGSHTGGGNTTPGAPINLTASTRRTALWEAIVSWSRWVLAEDQRAELQPADPVAYLRASTSVIRTNDWAGDLARDLTEHHAALVRAIDVPPDIISLGQCGTIEDDDTRCPGTIRTTRGSSTGKCRRCRTIYDAAEVQQERIDAAWHIHGTLSEVVRALRMMGERIELSTARKWVTRGVLTSDGKRPDGVALFTPAQVRRTMTQQATRHGRPRAA